MAGIHFKAGTKVLYFTSFKKAHLEDENTSCCAEGNE